MLASTDVMVDGMSSSSYDATVGWVRMLLGGLLLYGGYRTVFGERQQTSGLGRMNLLPESTTRAPGAGFTNNFDQGRVPGEVIRNRATIHTVGNIDERLQYIVEMMNESSLDPQAREAAARVLRRKCGTAWCVPEKNFMGEIKALFNEAKQRVRYTRDHVKVDQFQHRNVTSRLGIGDCFVKGTKVLRADHLLVAIESLRVGDKIWGLNRWSTVMNTWDKGVLPTWNIRLNNGSSMRLTPEHKVWVAICAKHGGQICSCEVSQRELRRVLVRELEPEMVVIQPEAVPGKTAEQRIQLRGGGGAAGNVAKLLRVKSVVRDGVEKPCFDIETDDHYVWLPEADWTTSQCDDQTIYLGAMLMAVGYSVRCRVVQTVGEASWNHIYLLVGVPPGVAEKWIALDLSVKGSTPGWQITGADEAQLSGRSVGDVIKVRDYDV